MSLTVAYSCWLSLTGLWKLLHVSHCLFQFNGVAAYLSLSPIVAGILYKCHGVAACLSLSPMVAGCLSLSLRSLELPHVSHCLSLLQAVSHCLSGL